MLGADVTLGAGGRFEGHRAAGALMEDLAVSGLNVGLDGVQASEHDLAARAPVSDASCKVQTGFLQVSLEACLSGSPTTLRTDMRRSVFVDPLVGRYCTRVRQHHGRRALRTCRVGSRSDLLEVSDQLSLAVKLRLALWTFEVVVLQPFGLLAGQRHQSLGTLRRAADRSSLT